MLEIKRLARPSNLHSASQVTCHVLNRGSHGAKLIADGTAARFEARPVRCCTLAQRRREHASCTRRLAIREESNGRAADQTDSEPIMTPARSLLRETGHQMARSWENLQRQHSHSRTGGLGRSRKPCGCRDCGASKIQPTDDSTPVAVRGAVGQTHLRYPRIVTSSGQFNWISTLTALIAAAPPSEKLLDDPYYRLHLIPQADAANPFSPRAVDKHGRAEKKVR